MLQRQRDPQAVARLRRDPRPGLASSPFLQSQLRGDAAVQTGLLESLCAWPMFADLLPASLLALAEHGTVKRQAAGELVIEQGARSDPLALVLEGEVQVLLGKGNTV